jgi:hypothetical protein
MVQEVLPPKYPQKKEEDKNQNIYTPSLKLYA